MSHGEQARETAVLDGLALANEIRAGLAEEIEKLVAAGHRAPRLAVVLVGDDPASRSYIKGKQRACARIGAWIPQNICLPESIDRSKNSSSLLDSN